MKAMESIVDRITEVVEPAVEAEGYLLVDVEFTGSQNGGTLRLFVDKPEGGISLADCEQISRVLSPLLDVENIIEGRYFLEISSPGINRRIKKKGDFERFVGAKVKIHLRSPQEGRRKVTGTIAGVEGGDIVLSEDPATPLRRVPLANIARANLQIM
jgi:ribosome maturation factor RimP